MSEFFGFGIKASDSFEVSDPNQPFAVMVKGIDPVAGMFLLVL